MAVCAEYLRTWTLININSKTNFFTLHSRGKLTGLVSLFLKLLFVVLVLFFGQSLSAQQHRITLNPAYRPFYHGVESGDPTEDHMIIWTRVTPDTGTSGDIDVYWQMATDSGF